MGLTKEETEMNRKMITERYRSIVRNRINQGWNQTDLDHFNMVNLRVLFGSALKQNTLYGTGYVSESCPIYREWMRKYKVMNRLEA
jgi:hypothetical protein